MKLSVSVYAGPAEQSDELVVSLSKLDIDYLHVDCKNSISVFEDLERWQKLTHLPFDVHLIASDPEPLIRLAVNPQIKRLCLQLEEVKTIPDNFWNGAYEKGLCITLGTPEEQLLPYADRLDYLMLMTTVPGYSGGRFPVEAFRKIHRLRNRFPHLPVEVDGGVTDATASVLRILGVDTAVSGSYILNHESPEQGLYRFHRPLNSTRTDEILIKDFMWLPEELPVISQPDLPFYEVLEMIDSSGMGFVLLMDETGVFKGVITNADVRKSLLKNRHTNRLPDAIQMLNASPASISENSSLRELIHLVNQLKNIILFLPVTDREGKLKGAVLLNQLTRF